jgi:hypothetical protein
MCYMLPNAQVNHFQIVANRKLVHTFADYSCLVA